MRSLETRAGERVPLTSAEFDLLACFIERPRRVLSRDQLLDWTRGRSADPYDRTIDVTMSRLRKKLESVDPAAETLLTTVRNGGYLFAAEVAEA
jgi:two-component system OmpR family response regulator